MNDNDSANVHVMKLVSREDVPPQRVLTAALGSGLTDAVVIGWDADGEFYFASSVTDGPEVLWLLEFAKRRLLDEGGA